MPSNEIATSDLVVFFHGVFSCSGHGWRRTEEPKEKGEYGKAKKALPPPTVPEMLLAVRQS
jgi:hypothetical protein